MAMILGEEITHKDLVPVFDGFLKDLDEVRIGVLKHLADFLRVCKPVFLRWSDIYFTPYKTAKSRLTLLQGKFWLFRMIIDMEILMVCDLNHYNH